MSITLKIQDIHKGKPKDVNTIPLPLREKNNLRTCIKLYTGKYIYLYIAEVSQLKFNF